MKTLMPIIVVLMIAIGVLFLTAPPATLLWLNKFIFGAMVLMTVAALAVRLQEERNVSDDYASREDVDMFSDETEYRITSSRGYAGPKDSRKVDNQPDQELIEQLRNTWQDEK